MTPPSRAAASPPALPDDASPLFLLAVAATLVGGLLALQARLNFNLADEGFLWYGAARTLAGDVPMRDFYAYDPGRYYWIAPFLRALGPGLVALRVANAAFAVVGLWCGLLVARRTVRHRGGLLLVAALLCLWMYPRHKLYEPAIAMIAVWIGTRLLERPSAARHAAAGAFVTLAAFFGKNHGLYAGLAFGALLLLRAAREGFTTWRARLREWGAAALGALAGALPLLTMFLLVPGFFAAYLRVVRYFADAGRTNQPLPFPWPWAVLSTSGPWSERALLATAGLGLLLLPLAYLPAVIAAWRTPRAELAHRAALIAAGAVGIFYLHHAFARTDSFHLAQAIHPALLAAVACLAGIASRAARWAGGLLLALLTLAGAVPDLPLVQRATPPTAADRYVDADLGGETIAVPARAANLLAALRGMLATEHCTTPVFLPHLPGLYPALGRTAPVWDIYPIWPARGERDERMRDELERHGVDCVLLDGYYAPSEPTFEQNYPATAAWIGETFTPAGGRPAETGLPRSLRLLVRKPAP